MQIHMLLLAIRHRLISLKRFTKCSNIMKSFTSFAFIAISIAAFVYGSAMNKDLHNRRLSRPAACTSGFVCSPALCPYGFNCSMDDIQTDDTNSECSAHIKCTFCNQAIFCKFNCPNGFLYDKYGCTACQCA